MLEKRYVVQLSKFIALNFKFSFFKFSSVDNKGAFLWKFVNQN